MVPVKTFYKTVMLPIKVAFGDFCWDGAEGRICDHFDNKGGHPTCGLNLDLNVPLKYDTQHRIPKPAECLNLL